MKIRTTALAALAGAACTMPLLADTADMGTVATLTIDCSGFESWDGLGDFDNLYSSFFLYPESHIIGIGWDVTITSYGASWLSEPTFEFMNSDESGGIYLSPGVGFDTSGTQSFDSAGMIDIVASGEDFYLTPDGYLHMELFENYDDEANQIDATFGAQSTVWIQYTVPTPGSLALLGLGGVVGARRRR